MVGLVTDAQMKQYRTDAKANDCEVQYDKDAGTVKILDGETVVLWGISKGPRGPWITRFTSSARISWSGTPKCESCGKPMDEQTHSGLCPDCDEIASEARDREAPCPSCGKVGDFGALCEECSEATEC